MSTPARELYPIDEARERLGGIARETIYRLIRSGELRTIQIGSRRMVPADAITDLIAQRSKRSAA